METILTIKNKINKPTFAMKLVKQKTHVVLVLVLGIFLILRKMH